MWSKKYTGERINGDWQCNGDEAHLFECLDVSNRTCNNTRAGVHCFGEPAIELFHVTSHVQIMTWHKKAAILVHIENVWAKIGTS